MDWLTFIADMTKAIVWPLAISCIIFVMRRPLANLLPQLQSLRWKDFQIDFGRRIESIEREAQTALPEVHLGEPQEGPGREDRFAALAEVSPSAAVLDAWLDVERALRAAASRHGIPLSPATLSSLARALAERGVLDPATMSIFDSLRKLRNNVAHAPEMAITLIQAKEFRDLALRLATKLESS